MTSRRTAGLALAGYVLLTGVAFGGSGTPGGAYEPDKVAGFLGGGHLAGALLGALLMAAGLALLPVGRHVREAVPGAAGELGADLAVVAAAAGVVGGMAHGGLSVALLEGGSPVAGGLPLPVAYTLGEIVNLLAVCAPAFALGALALLLAAAYPMPVWLRVLTVVGALGGLTAPLFVTFFVYLLWVLVLAGWLVVGGARAPQVRPVVATAPGAGSPVEA